MAPQTVRKALGLLDLVGGATGLFISECSGKAKLPARPRIGSCVRSRIFGS
jgi:hypothetical protein